MIHNNETNFYENKGELNEFDYIVCDQAGPEKDNMEWYECISPKKVVYYHNVIDDLPTLVEIIVDNEDDESMPSVTLDGKDLDMVQGSDGNWHHLVIESQTSTAYQIINKNVKLFDTLYDESFDGEFNELFDELSSNEYGYFAFVLDENTEKILWISGDYGIEKNEKASRHFSPYVSINGMIDQLKANPPLTNSTLGQSTSTNHKNGMHVTMAPHKGYLFGAATLDVLR